MAQYDTTNLVKLAEDIGFAIGIMKSFLEPSGTTGELVREAIERLEDAPEYIARIIVEGKKS